VGRISLRSNEHGLRQMYLEKGRGTKQRSEEAKQRVLCSIIDVCPGVKSEDMAVKALTSPSLLQVVSSQLEQHSYTCGLPII
jgi:hypothetical protein